MPMAYSYGLSIINTHLEKGAKIIINNDWGLIRLQSMGMSLEDIFLQITTAE